MLKIYVTLNVRITIDLRYLETVTQRSYLLMLPKDSQLPGAQYFLVQ
jgi:hypothetical protein